MSNKSLNDMVGESAEVIGAITDNEDLDTRISIWTKKVNTMTYASIIVWVLTLAVFIARFVE